jgi:polyphenol oxidase
MNRQGIVWGISKIAGGNTSLVYGDTSSSLDNRKKFLTELGIPWRDLICAKQVHGDNIGIVGKSDLGRGALNYEQSFDSTDAFVTAEKNVPLGIFTADCLPVFIFDPIKKVIAMVHAGWRSSHKGITAKVVNIMHNYFGVQPADILLWVGPAIGRCCYQVGEEFRDYFPDSVVKKDNAYFLDLINVNFRQAIAQGVLPANLDAFSHCTFCHNQEYFSFRRQGQDSGRCMSVIMLL